MISAAEFAAYNRAVAKIGDRAASDVETAVFAWCRAHEDATVAEKREAAKLIMEGFVQGYDDVAAEFAAQWYDDLAERNGARLQQAVTMTTYKPKSVDEVARYQARKLANGGDAAFAEACGEYARNDAFRSLNETIISNVGRDKDRGARFARVPTGFETCTFCIMLASRGAVYHTRKSAGEFRHFHRHCDCKVVPGFEDDPMAVLVEGHDPMDELARWSRLQNKDVVASGLYAKGGKNILDTAKRMDIEKSREWAQFKKTDRSASSWRETVGRYIEGFSSSGLVTTEDFVNPEGKELQVVRWLSEHGVSCMFRNPDVHKNTDGNTSDLLIDGETWDIKRITSARPKKIATAVFSKELQGPNFIVDLSCSSMSRDSAEAEIARLLDDDRISKIMLIKNRTATLYKK